MAWRWWPFGDRASAPAPPVGDPGRVATRDWAALPSIQRVVGPTRLTAESATFARTLPGHRPLEMAFASLGHLRSPEAPAGLLVARATAYQPRSSGLLELLRPRTWLRPADPQLAEPEAELSAEPEPTTEPLVEPQTPSPEVASPVAMRLAQVVSAGERPAPVLPSLTLAPALEHEAPAPAAVPVSTPVEPAPVVPLASEARPAGPRLNLGQSRRLGLGTPVSPPLPVVQRRTQAVGDSPDDAVSSGAAPVEAASPPPAPATVEPGTPAPEGLTLQRTGGEAAELPDSLSGPARTAPIFARPREAASPSSEASITASAPPSFREGADPVSSLSPRVTKPIVRVQRRAVDAPPLPIAPVPMAPAGKRTEVPEPSAEPMVFRVTASEATTAPSGVVLTGPPGGPDEGGRAPSELPATESLQPIVSRDTASEAPAGPAGGHEAGGPKPSEPPASGVPQPLVFRTTTADAAAAPSREVVAGQASVRAEGGMSVTESPVTGTTAPEPPLSSPMAPRGGIPPAPEGAAPSASAVAGVPPPLVFRTVAPGGEMPRPPEEAVASTRELQLSEPKLAGSPAGGIHEAREVQRPSEPAPPPPLVLMRPAAGAEPVRPLTGSVAPLLASAAGLRPVAIQAQRGDAPALAATGVVPGPRVGQTSHPEVGVAATALALRPFEGERPPSIGARPELPMPAPRFATPFTIQAMSLPGAPTSPVEPTTPTLAVPLPRTGEAGAAAVQRAGGFGHSLLEAAGSELGSARQAAETAGAREVGTARQALQTAGSQGLDPAQQAVHHAAGGGAGSTGSEADMAALAGRLYDHIRSRLRAELLIGRERAGQITDLR